MRLRVETAKRVDEIRRNHRRCILGRGLSHGDDGRSGEGGVVVERGRGGRGHVVDGHSRSVHEGGRSDQKPAGPFVGSEEHVGCLARGDQYRVGLERFGAEGVHLDRPR